MAALKTPSVPPRMSRMLIREYRWLHWLEVNLAYMKFSPIELSNHFSTPEKPVELTGRSCRERMDRVLEKYKSKESRSLKRYPHILIIYREALSFQLYVFSYFRSGTEDEFTELKQLWEDIVTFRRDFAEAKQKEKESKKAKEERDKKEMRRAAMKGMASMLAC